MTQPYNALYGPPQAPVDNALYYDDTQGMPRQRPADPLRWLADAVGQNKDLPAPQFFMDPRALSVRNMLHSGLGTAANWLDGTKDPSLVGPAEMVSPTGLAGMAGPMSGAFRRGGAAVMADNAKGSAPGTVLNSLDMSEAARMSRAREQGFDTERPLYHGTKADFDAFRPSEKGKFGSGVYFSPDRQFADEWTSGNGRVIEAYGRGKMADDAAWAKARDAEYSADGSRSMFEIENAAAKRLQSEGYAGVSSKARGESVVFDTKDIRSTQAAFDPAKRDSAMLLAADNAKGSAPGTVVNSIAERRALGDYDLVRTPGGTGDTMYTLVNRGQSPGDADLGHFNVKTSQRNPAGMEVTNAFIDEPLRRQGLGSKIYDQIESDFRRPLYPSPTDQLSDHAKNFWQKRAPERLSDAKPIDEAWGKFKGDLDDTLRRSREAVEDTQSTLSRWEAGTAQHKASLKADMEKAAADDAAWAAKEAAWAAKDASRKTRDDQGVMSILRRYGLAD